MQLQSCLNYSILKQIILPFFPSLVIDVSVKFFSIFDLKNCNCVIGTLLFQANGSSSFPSFSHFDIDRYRYNENRGFPISKGEL